MEITFRTTLLLFSILINLTGLWAWASPQALTYQGRIIKANGTPLSYSSVSFMFRIFNPAGTCLLYQEQYNGYDMSTSSGVFDVPIGSGIVSYPADGSLNILGVFNNATTFTCQGGATYAPVSGAHRLLRVLFHDGSGWQTITPDIVIRSVPYAGYASSAERLGNFTADEFLLKAGLPTCGPSTFLSYDGSSLACVPVSGASGGTVTSVTSSNGYISVANSTSTPVLTLNVGTAAGTVAAGNDSRLANAIQSSQFPSSCAANQTLTFLSPSGSFSCSSIAISGTQVSGNIAGNATGFTGSLVGDVTGTQSATSVDKIKGVGVDFSVAPTNNQVLTFNGSNWVAASLPATTSSQWTTTGAHIYYTTGNVGIGTTNPSVSLHVVGGALITSGMTAGSYTTNGNVISGNGSVSSPGFKFFNDSNTGIYLTANDSNTMGLVTDGIERLRIDSSGNIGIGTASPGYKLDVNGDVNITGNFNTKGTIYTDTGANTVTIAGPNSAIGTSYILRLPTSQGSASQVLTNDGSGNLSWTTPSTTATSYSGVLPITNGGTNSSTALSNNRIMVSSGGAIVEASALTNGQILIGSAGAAPVGANLTAGSGISVTNSAGGITIATTGLQSSTLADGKILVGNSSNVATAVTPSSDVAMTNAGAFTVTKLQGTSVNSTTPTTAGQVLRYNGSSWTPNFVSMADLRSTITGASALTSCASNQTLTWSAATDNLACSNISLPASQITGTLAVAHGGTGVTATSQGTVFAGPASGAGAPGFRALASTDLPSGTLSGSGTAGYVPYYSAASTLANSGIYYSGGRVGVGTTSPQALLNSDYNPAITANSSSNYLAGWSQVSPAQSYNYTGALYGHLGRISIGSSQTGSITTATGSQGDVYHQSDSSSVTNAYGVNASVANQGASTITTAAGLRGGVSNTGSGAITNAYGLWITGVTGTNAWSIYSQSTADSYFAGRVGIGTTSPSAKLHALETSTTTAARIENSPALAADSASSYYGAWNTVTPGSAYNFTSSLYASVNRLAPTSSQTGTINTAYGSLGDIYSSHTGTITKAYGTVGSVGNLSSGTITTAYAGYFGVTNSGTGSIANAYGIQIGTPANSGGGTLGTYYGLYIATPTAATTNYALYSQGGVNYFGGNVGIGTSSPSYTLHVVGTAGLSTGTAWTNASDIRLKDIHGDYEYGLSEVLRLHTVRYNYKKDNALGLPSDFEKTGFIAQEVQKVIPDAVKERDDGYLELNVDPIHWSAVNGIRELYHKWFSDSQEIHEKLEQQKRELASKADKVQIDSLLKENAELKARLDRIEKSLRSK